MALWPSRPFEALQRQGLGGQLLRAMLDRLRQERVDAVGAMFGLKPWLLKLWGTNGTQLVWVAHASEPSSGHHSAVVLEPLNVGGQRLVERLQQRLLQQLPELLPQVFKSFDLETFGGPTAWYKSLEGMERAA